MSSYTAFAGLYKLDPGDPVSLNNYEFYENEEVIDHYIQAFIGHRHDGTAAMSNFASAATIVSSASGGQLPPSVTYYVGITAIDQYGGETAATSTSAVTAGTVNDPTVAPVCVAGAGGSLNLGTYRYAYTFIDVYGETIVSPQTNITVTANGKVTLTLPTGSLQKRVYRAYGYGEYNKVADVAALSSTFVDDGTLCINCDQSPPDDSTAGATNKLIITRPALPSGAVSWKVYVSEESGLPSPSLLFAYGASAISVIPAAASGVTFSSENEIRVGTPPILSRTIPGAYQILGQDVFYGGPVSGLVPSGNVESAIDFISGTYIGQIYSMASAGPGSASAAKGWNTAFDNAGGVDVTVNPGASAVRFRAGMSQVLYRPVGVGTPDAVSLARQDWTYVYSRGVRASAYQNLQSFHNRVDIGTVTDYRFCTPATANTIDINDYYDTYVASGMTVVSTVTITLPSNAYDGYTCTIKRHGSANTATISAGGGFQIEQSAGAPPYATTRVLVDHESLTLFWVSSMQTWMVK